MLSGSCFCFCYRPLPYKTTSVWYISTGKINQESQRPTRPRAELHGEVSAPWRSNQQDKKQCGPVSIDAGKKRIRGTLTHRCARNLLFPCGRVDHYSRPSILMGASAAMNWHLFGVHVAGVTLAARLSAAFGEHVNQADQWSSFHALACNGAAHKSYGGFWPGTGGWGRDVARRTVKQVKESAAKRVRATPHSYCRLSYMHV